MNAFNNESKRMAALLICVLMMFGSLAVILASSSFSSAEEEEPEVEEVEVGDECYLLFDGVYYFVTNDEESEEEVAVAGLQKDASNAVVNKNPSIPGYITYVFEEDGEEVEIVYLVSGILGTADEGSLGGLSNAEVETILLPTTIMSIGSGALNDLVVTAGFLTLPAVLSDGTVKIVGIEDEETDSGYVEMTPEEYFPECAAYGFIDESTGVEVKFHLNVTDAAERKATNADDFEDDAYSQMIFNGVNNVLFPVAFERDYFSLAGWSVNPNDCSDLVGDCDAVKSDFAVHTDYYAIWEEDSCFEDYPEWMMWVTVAIIVILAILGIAMVVIRTIQGRKA